jgi:hypothetical protein
VNLSSRNRNNISWSISTAAASLVIRVHNCTRFWGAGVPDDYTYFLDHYKPRDKTYTFHTALSRKYEAMRCKWSARLPVPQPQVVEDPALCAALWTLGSFHLNSSFRQLIRVLQPWAGKLAFFESKEECDKESKSVSPVLLHHTFFQFQTFPLDEAQCSELKKPLLSWAEVAQSELSKLPPYYLNVEGTCVTRSGIVVLGFPPTDYTSVRNALRNAGHVKEPHQQDVHHITIARWIRPISGEEMTAVIRVLECFRGVWLGMLQPETWSVGFATLSMLEETLRPVYSWQALPAPWVLHRGNMFGLNKVTENDPLILKKHLNQVGIAKLIFG